MFISDDVSKSVRQERKKLKEIHLGEIRQLEDIRFCIHSLERTSSDNCRRGVLAPRTKPEEAP